MLLACGRGAMWRRLAACTPAGKAKPERLMLASTVQTMAS